LFSHQSKGKDLGNELIHNKQILEFKNSDIAKIKGDIRINS